MLPSPDLHFCAISTRPPGARPPPPATCARLPAPNRACARYTSIAVPQPLPVYATRTMNHATRFPPPTIFLPLPASHLDLAVHTVFADCHPLLVCATGTSVRATQFR